MELAKEMGAKKAIPLVVSGAFHSPLMENACEGLENVLNEIEIKEANFAVYTNVHAHPVRKPEDIKYSLREQLTSPVRWVEIIENMIKNGASKFYEIGPGSVLTGLLKRINRDVVGQAVSNLENMEKIYMLN